jgi:hypothetical protein
MKKTNKVNPVTFFRKANEDRQASVKKSIKKAQDGIETNDDLINKAGSTGGYKTPVKKWWLGEGNMPNLPKPESGIKKYMPWDSKAELIDPASEKLRKDLLTPTDPNYNSNPPASSNFSGPKSLKARMSTIKQKTGGTVKRKK